MVKNRTRNMRLTLGIFGLLVPGFAFAQTNLVTDRPGFTASAVVAAFGHVQLESGFTWEHGESKTKVLSGPEMLVRWAVARRFELRFGIPDHIDVRNSNSLSGFGDSSIGAKIQLSPTNAAWDLASIVTLSLPTGNDEFSSDDFDPELILTAGKDLTGSWSIGGQVMAAAPTANNDRSILWGGTLVLGTSLSERWGAFAEVAATLPETGSAIVVFHNGYTYLARPNLQLDVHGGAGLSSSAPDFFIGGGFGVLF